jgi:hypothetical protein
MRFAHSSPLRAASWLLSARPADGSDRVRAVIGYWSIYGS